MYIYIYNYVYIYIYIYDNLWYIIKISCFIDFDSSPLINPFAAANKSSEVDAEPRTPGNQPSFTPRYTSCDAARWYRIPIFWGQAATKVPHPKHLEIWAVRVPWSCKFQSQKHSSKQRWNCFKITANKVWTNLYIVTAMNQTVKTSVQNFSAKHLVAPL